MVKHVTDNRPCLGDDVPGVDPQLVEFFMVCSDYLLRFRCVYPLCRTAQGEEPVLIFVGDRIEDLSVFVGGHHAYEVSRDFDEAWV